MPATAMRSLIAVLLALLPALPAAAQSDAGKTLRLAPHADLSIVDPHFSGVYITRNFGYLVCDTLLAFDHEFQPRPQMVDTWQVSDDKLTYTFRLRDGLKFHDGQPVRAADAVASLKRWGQRNDAYGQLLLAAASAIEATDDKQFRIVLKQRFPVLEALATMTTPTPFIMPERLAQTDPYTQITEVDGSGPFKFVKEEWQPGHKVAYVKNPDYVPRAEPPDNLAGGKVAKVDRVEWLYIPEPVTAVQALETGEVDYLENAPMITPRRWRNTRTSQCAAIPALSVRPASTISTLSDQEIKKLRITNASSGDWSDDGEPIPETHGEKGLVITQILSADPPE